ncbi:hypothetical protein VMCG_09188 [Cytospora schulzeri]|uniref:C2H2-type domain-containing protein n=1 Tax=Cytospora schulzeri TaxID=448051 RepID=A0A423VLP9_9PEZI|nr:hypothetical protein VMCG_09188 [Valsa malicola]
MGVFAMADSGIKHVLTGLEGVCSDQSLGWTNHDPHQHQDIIHQQTLTDTTTNTTNSTSTSSSITSNNNGSMEPPVPTADPESMDVKKGLNKWGAFDSFSGSGTGTFGFGPLLFHHHVDETPRDPYDTNKLLLNDPISFNPLDAISWAKLDDDPAFDDGQAVPVVAVSGGVGDGAAVATAAAPATAAATNQDAVEAPPQPAASMQQKKKKSKKSRDDDDHVSSNYVVASPASPATSRIGSDVSGSRASSVAGSSVGNMSRTFSNTSLVSPDNTSSMSRRPGSLQARKRHRRQAKPVQHAYQQQQHQQQQLQQPPQPPHPPSAPSEEEVATAIPAHSSVPSTRFPSSAPHPNNPDNPEPDLLLCLGPHCSARFRTEAGLNAHYQAEHSFKCDWLSCREAAAVFTSSNALAWHVKAEHLLECPVPGCCGMVYPDKKVLDAHLKVSDDRLPLLLRSSGELVWCM